MNRLVEKIKLLIDWVFNPEGHPRVMGVFPNEEVCIKAILKLRTEGYKRLIVHSPAPSHHLEAAIGKGPSIVRYFTLVGGILGAAGGFSLASWTSVQWDLVVSGKPIISVPPYLIITFECTILLGAIFTLVGFLHSSRLPRPDLGKLYQGAFGDDKFGIGIVCDENEIKEAEKALVAAGAEEVRDEA